MNVINQFSRSELLLGPEAMERMRSARVIIFGIGGVGSWAAETLVRTGVANLTIVDFDRVTLTNINRQQPATHSTVGMLKTDVIRSHLLDINPDASITAIDGIYSPETASQFDLDSYDYVIDAIDSLRDKALLICNATRAKCRLFSSMGAALKTDPQKIAVANFYDVKGCRLAAALRNRFKRSGSYPARKFKVVYSPEIKENRHLSDEAPMVGDIVKPTVNGSLMQITAIFGITLASLVINDLATKP